MAPTYKNFIYMEEQGFIFAYVPKVACTNWKALLRYMAGHADWLDTRLAHDKKAGGLRYLDPADPAERALLDDPGLRVFAMVRDPYSRTLSAYLNKVENRLPPEPEKEGENHFRKVVRAIDAFRRDTLDVDTFPEITFEVFLRWLKAGQSWFTNDEHWTAQTTLLHHPDIRFDILGRFERLGEDAPRILDAMGCTQPFPSQAEVKFAPTHATARRDAYYKGPEQALVEEIFAADFDAYGYARLSVGPGTP